MRPVMAMTAALLVLSSLGTIEPVYCDDAPVADKAHGAEVFDKWCAPCHAAGPNHPGTQALDAKYMGKLPGPLQERRDLTKETVKTFVRQGVSIMPYFRKTEISDSDLDALSAYLAK